MLSLAGERLDHGGHVLDIGCGGGWMLQKLGQSGIGEERLHGVDLIEPRVEIARRRLPAADIRLADARALPHGDAEFSLVLLLLCLSSMPDSGAVRVALREAHRVLAPGGALLCYEPRISNPFNRATIGVSRTALRATLGQEESSLALTGFPPLARRLGQLTPLCYPVLARLVPWHRLSVYCPSRST